MWESFTNLFKGPPTLEERLNDNRKTLKKTLRDTNREIKRLERTELELKGKIRKAAEQQQMARAQMICRNLVRHRAAITNMYKVATQVESTMLHLQTVKTTAALASSMKQTYKVLYIMNRQTNLPELQRLLMFLERETEIMDMKQELMNDATDSMLETDGDEAEEKRIFDSIMEEIGLGVVDNMKDVPVNNNNNYEVDEEMQKRINDLRK